MKLFWLTALIVFTLALSSATIVSKNGTKWRKVVRKVKKISNKTHNATKDKDISKSESYHIPVVIAPLDRVEGHQSIPVNIEYNNGRSSADPYLNAKVVRVLSPHEVPVHVPNYEPPANEYHHGHDLGNDHISDGSDYANSHSFGDDYNGNSGWKPVLQPNKQQQQRNDYYQNHLQTDDFQHHGHLDNNHHYENDFSAIPGIPGVDYPTYASLPETHFKCLKHTSTPGFYADVDTKCQVWHYCQPDGRHDRFLCPNGTVFDQLTRVCNWWYNVQCDDSLSMYDINFDLYRDPPSKISKSSEQHYEEYGNGLPSENLVVIPPHQPSVQSQHMNSFLDHVKVFEGRHHRVGDYLPEANDISSPVSHDHSKAQQNQAAARPESNHYPFQMAPTPVIVVRDSSERDDNHHQQYPIHQPRSAALVLQKHIEYSPHNIVKENEEPRYIAPINGPHGLADESASTSQLWKPFKMILNPLNEEIDDDDLPTYIERQAAPPFPASSNKKKYRVIKRRRLYKD